MSASGSDEDYLDRIEVLRRKLKQHAMDMSLSRSEKRHDDELWATIWQEHQRRLSLISGQRGLARSILEDIRFDFSVLMQDLRRFFVHPLHPDTRDSRPPRG